MARKPMVTRSFEVTRVNVMCVNTVTAEVHNIDLEVPRKYDNEDKLMKVVKSMIETDEEKAVQIVDKSVYSKLYGMSEADFLKNSIELDPETRKILEDNGDTEDEETEDEEEE